MGSVRGIRGSWMTGGPAGIAPHPHGIFAADRPGKLRRSASRLGGVPSLRGREASGPSDSPARMRGPKGSPSDRAEDLDGCRPGLRSWSEGSETTSMLLSRFFGRRDVRSSRRPLPRRRPLVEDLEGRQLLTAFTVGVAGGNGQTSAMVVGSHIGSNAMVVGKPHRSERHGGGKPHRSERHGGGKPHHV